MEYSKIYHGQLIDLLANTNCLTKDVDEQSETVKFIGDDITINIPTTSDFNLLTHKLLIYADILFTEEYNKKKYIKAKVGVSIAKLMDVFGLSTSSRSSIDRGHREIKKSLQTLIDARIKINEGMGEYAYHNNNMQMFDNRSKLKNGVVYLFFTDEFAAYLVGRPIAKYPDSLFRINGKMQNAYSIGYKMALHASNRNNIRKGTFRTLSVKNLLKCTTYPSPKSLKSSRQSWREKIEKRLEKDLDYLMLAGVLDIWIYRGKTNENDRFAKYIDFINEKIEFDFSE